MNVREKMLATAVAGLIGVFGLGFGARAMFLKPLRAIDARIKASKNLYDKIASEKRQYFATEDRMKLIAQKTFGDTVDQVSATSGEMLTKRILQSGLEESDFTRLPVNPPKNLKGAKETGWIVQGEGPLPNIVNLLFVLENSPYLHRVENVALSTGDGPGRMKVRFRYLTLVLDPSPEVTRKPLADKFALDSNERRSYDDLVARDVFRPYIKRPPPPPEPPGKGSGTPAPNAAPPGPESFKVVSLTEWNGQPEIHVLDGTGQRTARYKPGDQLAGGTVVCVDYRELPVLGSFALSESRVILKIGSDFWAIERGKTLADKYKMTAEQLPGELANAVK